MLAFPADVRVAGTASTYLIRRSHCADQPLILHEYRIYKLDYHWTGTAVQCKLFSGTCVADQSLVEESQRRERQLGWRPRARPWASCSHQRRERREKSHDKEERCLVDENVQRVVTHRRTPDRRLLDHTYPTARGVCTRPSRLPTDPWRRRTVACWIIPAVVAGRTGRCGDAVELSEDESITSTTTTARSKKRGRL